MGNHISLLFISHLAFIFIFYTHAKQLICTDLIKLAQLGNVGFIFWEMSSAARG